MSSKQKKCKLHVGDLRIEIVRQLGLAIEEIAETKSAGDETIHKVRRRGKRMRALLAMMSDQGVAAAARASRDVRDAARPLSPLRDAQIIPAALRNVRSLFAVDLDESWLSGTGTSEGSHPLSNGDPIDLPKALNKADRKLKHARRCIAEAGKIDDRPLKIKALANGYRAGRKQIVRLRAEQSSVAFHRFRKLVKTHLYQCRFFATRCNVKLTDRIGRLEKLAEHLGAAQDIAVLRRAVKAHGNSADQAARQAFDQACEIAIREQQEQALSLAYPLYFDAPKQFVRGL
jgi:CHAD domain-containing protein